MFPLLLAAAHATAATDAFTRELSRGPVYAALAAFVGGLLVCLTPCVYPMIAITVSVFGAREAPSRAHAMGLSTAFVAGIAAMFTPLGVGAALTGSLFGSALSHPWVVAPIAVVFLLLSASMLGAFDLVLPPALVNRLAQIGGSGFGGAFLLGLVSGIIAAPCTGPVLTGILIWIGRTRDPWLGAGALFAFSLGLGLPFWLVGTFAVRLPKSGPWMTRIKGFFGIVLAVAALYLLLPHLPWLSVVLRNDTAHVALYVAIGLVGLILTFFTREHLRALANAQRGDAASTSPHSPTNPATHAAEHAAEPARRRSLLAEGLGLVFAVVGSFLAIGALKAEGPTSGAIDDLPWETSEESGRARAAAEHKPMLIDFTAAWCAACGEIARETLSDARVRVETARFVTVQIDATHDDDPRIDVVKDRYGVVGLPTVVLLDSQGRERTRFTEFVAADKMLDALKQVN